MARALDLPTLFLRIEGGVLLSISVLLYAQTEQSWWLFALLLLPDVSIAGYAGGPKVGAVTYNAFRTYLPPAVLAVLCAVADLELPLALAFIWFALLGTAGSRSGAGDLLGCHAQ